jgi:hypothetical protein
LGGHGVGVGEGEGASSASKRNTRYLFSSYSVSFNEGDVVVGHRSPHQDVSNHMPHAEADRQL